MAKAGLRRGPSKKGDENARGRENAATLGPERIAHRTGVSTAKGTGGVSDGRISDEAYE